MELVAHYFEDRGVLYRCPYPACTSRWMTGGGMWQHLRGNEHFTAHDVASAAIEYARAEVLAHRTEALGLGR